MDSWSETGWQAGAVTSDGRGPCVVLPFGLTARCACRDLPAHPESSIGSVYCDGLIRSLPSPRGCGPSQTCLAVFH